MRTFLLMIQTSFAEVKIKADACIKNLFRQRFFINDRFLKAEIAINLREPFQFKLSQEFPPTFIRALKL